MKRVKQAIHYWCDDTLTNKFCGQNIGVAVLDSGIVMHPDFDSRVVAFRDTISNKNRVYDDNGHGTHVTGIIAGSGEMSGCTYGGMAPGSHIMSIKVLDEKGNGCIQHVISGLKTVLNHYRRFNIRVVNISVGTFPHIGNKEEEQLIEWVERVWDAGIVVVAAAGNYGPEGGTITTPGNSRKVITVGSSNDQHYVDNSGRSQKNYSGRGPTKSCICKPDVVAPGSYITACNVNYNNKNQKPYSIKSGTSMSTPVVSGAIALLLSKYPDMSNVEIKLRLRETCDDLHLPKPQQGWGQINVAKLLAL